MTTNLEERAEELAARQYTEIIFRDRTTTDGYMYVAVTPEITGCMVQGETLTEAKENLRLFRADCIQHLLEHNLEIPAPSWMSSQTIRNKEPELTFENKSTDVAQLEPA